MNSIEAELLEENQKLNEEAIRLKVIYKYIIAFIGLNSGSKRSLQVSGL